MIGETDYERRMSDFKCVELGEKIGYKKGFEDAKKQFERPHGECNQCRHYEGVHGAIGHAPCSYWGIGGVLWSDYCSRFEKRGEAE